MCTVDIGTRDPRAVAGFQFFSLVQGPLLDFYTLGVHTSCYARGMRHEDNN